MTLKPADAAALIGETASSKSILVGGQAVAFWATYYKIQPTLPVLTFDIDYLATATEAKKAANSISFPATLKVATIDDQSPNTALLTVKLEGYSEPILVDYLAQIIGPDSKAIDRTAMLVEYERHEIRIIHPLLLLQSKIANIYRLETKRSKEGIEQARLAISIAAAYVEELVNSKAEQREILRAVQSISKYAATEPARYANENFGLDCSRAIPTSALKPGVLPKKFHTLQLPRLNAAIKLSRTYTKTSKSRTASSKKQKN